MKKLILVSLISAFAFAGNVNFNYNTQNADASVKSYLTKTLKKECSAAFEDAETVVTVTNIEVIRIDQGMELEYTATVKVVEDYGHSPAKIITVEFDEERYHGEGFSLFKITAPSYLCN
ncbi:hypothetical protein [Bacteriovorax sp. DB6_IX]|uniref:hypothetical protein n=1 Tax=Bacteriovorax sp. DB6_IX TaxID=1353530 RepID=UPI00038A2E15|nr:hypothetical protein [Bacteriovorax sp. DB6_IX]EQC43183.1 hypothetical protein M901_3111 [Bacteriovorax sp. DB6_IX]